MDDTLHGEALEAIEGIFGDRMKRGSVGEEGTRGEALAVVSPVNVREVELLAEVAGRYSYHWPRWRRTPSMPPCPGRASGTLRADARSAHTGWQRALG